MILTTVLSPVSLTAACLAAVSALLIAHRQDSTISRVVFKLAASTCFVLVAVALNASGTTYGQFILAALVLGWLGDALLLSSAAKAFLGGLIAFLLSHLLFAAGFLSDGVSVPAAGIAVVVAAALGWVVFRWLLPHTPSEFRLPVLAYVVVILAMVVAATGHAFATERWPVLVGALLFAASDIAVARERFVKQSFTNQLWGWPAYFAAQLVLAWTVAAAVSVA